VVVFVGFRLFGVWLGLDFLAQPLVDDCGVCFGLLDGLPDGGVCGLGPDVWSLFGSALVGVEDGVFLVCGGVDFSVCVGEDCFGACGSCVGVDEVGRGLGLSWWWYGSFEGCNCYRL